MHCFFLCVSSVNAAHCKCGFRRTAKKPFYPREETYSPLILSFFVLWNPSSGLIKRESVFFSSAICCDLNQRTHTIQSQPWPAGQHCIKHMDGKFIQNRLPNAGKPTQFYYWYRAKVTSLNHRIKHKLIFVTAAPIIMWIQHSQSMSGYQHCSKRFSSLLNRLPLFKRPCRDDSPL